MPEREPGVGIHVHIEKTGGTTLRRHLLELYGADNILIYQPRPGEFYWASEVRAPRTNPGVDLIKKVLRRFPVFMPIVARINVLTTTRRKGYSLDEIKGLEPKVVQGHFTADLLEGVYPQPLWIVVLRHPLERMISHYWHYQINRGENLFRVQPPFPLSFEDFAFHSFLRNYQTQALGKRPLEEFDLAGTTENLLSFVQRLTLLLVGEWPDSLVLPRLNKLPRKPTLSELGVENTEEFVRLFEQHHALDYQNYHQALEFSQQAFNYAPKLRCRPSFPVK